MENSFQTSFIPKKPIINNGGTLSAKGNNSIFIIVSVIVIVIVGLFAGGLYFYKDYLTKDKDQIFSSILKIKDSFDEDTIAELATYDKKSSVAREVLDGHIVLSPLFEAINEYTLSSIQYTKFDHGSTANVFSVRMSGVANDYKSIAMQADVFSKNKPDMFKNLVFSNLTKDKNNFVTFNVEFTVDPKLLLYSGNIKNINSNTNNNSNNQDVSALNFDNTIDSQSLTATRGIQ